MAEFDAGSAVGKLELDNSGFTHSLLEAEGISRLFPQVVTDFLADPLLGFTEIAKESGEALIDAFKETQQDAEEVGLTSLKLGVSPEFFSQWAAVGQTVNVGKDQLFNGLRYLELHAQEALEGSKTAAKGFNDLGISMKDLEQHSSDPAWLFDRIREGLDRLAPGQQRVLAAQELMARGGQSLLPILSLTTDHIDQLKKSFGLFGDDVDEGEVKAAQKFNDLEAVAHWAFEGIQEAATRPVLQFFADHADQIESGFEGVGQGIIGEIHELWSALDTPAAHQFFEEVKSGSKEAFETLAAETKKGIAVLEGPEGKKAFGDLGAEAKDLWSVLTGQQAKAAMKDMEDFSVAMVRDIPKIADGVVSLTGDLSKAFKNMEQMAHGQMPVDNSHDALTDGIAEIFAQREQAEVNQLHLTPQARKRAEEFIHHELGLTPLPGSSDSDIRALMDRAHRHQEGIDHRFPGQNPDQHPSSADQEVSLLHKIVAGTDTTDDRKKLRDLMDADRASQTAQASNAAAAAPTINIHMNLDPSSTAAAVWKVLEPLLVGKLKMAQQFLAGTAHRVANTAASVATN